jgi:hypothetical protein
MSEIVSETSARKKNRISDFTHAIGFLALLAFFWFLALIISSDKLHDTFQHCCLPQGEKKINFFDRKIYYLIGYKELKIKNRRKMKTLSPVPTFQILCIG